MNFLAKTITNLESRLDSVLLGEQEQQQAHKKPVPDKKSNLDGGSKGCKVTHYRLHFAQMSESEPEAANTCIATSS